MNEFWEPNASRLKQIIKDTAFALEPHVVNIGNPIYILATIATVESSFGERSILRHEPAYMPDGYYYKNSTQVQERWKRWQILSACSFSSFQILYTTACELGFDHQPWDRNPIELWDDRIAAQFVVKYLVKRVISKMPDNSLERLFDGYNSGNPRDGIIPHEYIQKSLKAYESLSTNKVII